jgi:hypothetical protein
MMLLKNLFLVFGICGLLAAGCNKPASEEKPAATPAAQTSAGHTHGAWWCDEHGVPEEVCGLCSKKVADDMKTKGDWCREHDRPDSQCFVCHPEFEAQFAAQYEAKYGKKPPKPNAEG